MGYLQNVGVGLLLFLSSILAGALGLFHKTTAATRTATSTGTAVGYSNDLTPCDNDTNIPTNSNVPILDGHGLATGLFRHGNCIYFTTPAFSGSIRNADAATFVSLNDRNGYFSGYAKDKNSVFFLDDYNGAIVVPDADPGTFTPLEPPYAKDSHHVYVDAAFLADADPLSFTVDVDINGQYWGYAHDEDHMWRYGELQEISY